MKTVVHGRIYLQVAALGLRMPLDQRDTGSQFKSVTAYDSSYINSARTRNSQRTAYTADRGERFVGYFLMTLA